MTCRRKRREHGRYKEDKRAKTSRFHPINNRSPFSDDILADTLPRSYKPISLDYDGTTDPEVHLNRFEGLVTLHMYTEGIKCRIFSTTLTGLAQLWFGTLAPNSIRSFEELQVRFLRQFASSRRVGKSALSLMDIKHDQNEILREYTARFNLAALEVPEAESQIKNCAYVRGLKPGLFFDELQIRPARDFDDIMSRLPGYLQLEDARMARKAENDKHKAKRAEEAPERQRHQEGPLSEDYPLGAPGTYRDGQPQQGPNNKLCEYHNAYGHFTKHCGHLKHQLEFLVRAGNLDQFIARGNEAQAQRQEQRNEPRQDQGNNRDRRPEENWDSYRGGAEGRVPPFPYRIEVHMIFGENGIPTSNRAKKQVVRAVNLGYYPKQVMEITSAADEPTITFGSEDLRTLMYPHDDALVIMADIASYIVHRVFIDSGSAVNILYLECLQNMGVEAHNEPTNAPLFGFGGEMVMPIGFVELSLTLGYADASKTKVIRFLVVDMPKPSYNVILGRPALTTFRAIISMFHLKMKFPIGGGRVGEVWGDQKASKACHVQMFTHSSGQKRERITEGPDTRKNGKVGEVNAPAEERQELAGLLKDRDSAEKTALVSTSDVGNMIELFPGQEGFQTKIGSSMDEQTTGELINCLRRNADVFAFSTADLKGIDRGLAEHCLNVDLRVKPVKQRTRHFGAEKDAAIRE
ncbi:uncharacterized protein LOC131025746 [Salvia miltiorrhiza]|uniref:uncharacterized protein LOC131025746 n=1 Tax=Salvia miltiorrhiza TaxID=226208 RepID=UPI0025ACEBD7|nr:uncharacterized protein LOC131025746 [Salvia miltiorrhiza]